MFNVNNDNHASSKTLGTLSWQLNETWPTRGRGLVECGICMDKNNNNNNVHHALENSDR